MNGSPAEKAITLIIRGEVRHCTDAEAKRLAVESNLARRDLHPARKARAVAEWKDVYEEQHPEARSGGSGRGRERGSAPKYSALASKMLGVPERTVERLARLGALAIDAVLDAWASDRITQTQAESIAKLVYSEQQAALDDALTATEPEPTPHEQFQAAAQGLTKALRRVLEAARLLDETRAERINLAFRPARDVLGEELRAAQAESRAPLVSPASPVADA